MKLLLSVFATIGEETFICLCHEFIFMMGSMGQVVGEKITKAFSRRNQTPITSSHFYCFWGARMQEGNFSLMQMAKNFWSG